MHSTKRSLLAIVLAVLMLLPCFAMTACGDDEIDGIIEFDFKGTNFSKYMTVSRDDYFGLGVTIDKIDEIDTAVVDKYINDLRVSYATTTNKSDGVIQKNDTVKIYYRGQVEVNGAPVDFLGGSNLTSSPSSLVIGSGNFIDGFEDALTGKEFTDSRIVLWTDENKHVGDQDKYVLYISYTYKYTENGKEKTGTHADRISLEKNEDGSYKETQNYSVALRDALRDPDNTIGTTLSGPYTESLDLTGDLVPETATLSNVKITHIVKEDTPFVFKVSFPENYPNNPDIAGKEATWYVYVTALARPTLPEINYDFVNGKLGLTYDDVAAFVPEGTAVNTEAQKKSATVTAFRPFVENYLKENREMEVEQAAITAYWEAIMEKITVKEYPGILLEDAIKLFWNQAEAGFEEYVYNYGEEAIADVEEYMVKTYGKEYFPNGTADIDAGVKRLAEEYLKQQMLVHYIADEEGLNLTYRERNKGRKERIQAMLDYYNAQNGTTTGSANALTEEDLEAAGYTKDVILDQLLYEKVCDAIYQNIKDKVIQK